MRELFDLQSSDKTSLYFWAVQTPLVDYFLLPVDWTVSLPEVDNYYVSNTECFYCTLLNSQSIELFPLNTKIQPCPRLGPPQNKFGLVSDQFGIELALDLVSFCYQGDQYRTQPNMGDGHIA